MKGTLVVSSNSFSFLTAARSKNRPGDGGLRARGGVDATGVEVRHPEVMINLEESSAQSLVKCGGLLRLFDEVRSSHRLIRFHTKHHVS